MRLGALLLALCRGCGGFDLTITVGVDHRYGSLQQNGMPVPAIVIEQSFDSMQQAQHTPIPFEVEDGTGVHAFDLRRYVGCDGDRDPPSLEVGLLLTYSTTCLPEPVHDGTTLGLCWDGSRCGNQISVP